MRNRIRKLLLGTTILAAPMLSVVTCRLPDTLYLVDAYDDYYTDYGYFDLFLDEFYYDDGYYEEVIFID